jgi:hypothetical protein
MSADQLYYWTAAWQAGEAETAEDVRKGSVLRFDTTDDAIRWLLRSE